MKYHQYYFVDAQRILDKNFTLAENQEYGFSLYCGKWCCYTKREGNSLRILAIFYAPQGSEIYIEKAVSVASKIYTRNDIAKTLSVDYNLHTVGETRMLSNAINQRNKLHELVFKNGSMSYWFEPIPVDWPETLLNPQKGFTPVEMGLIQATRTRKPKSDMTFSDLPNGKSLVNKLNKRGFDIKLSDQFSVSDEIPNEDEFWDKFELGLEEVDEESKVSDEQHQNFRETLTKNL
ncbi:MAG: hypothetical protein R8G66_26055 [Cytophagales bacterium]|nr:hypothetical protein [Cytophagales bacterium]